MRELQEAIDTGNISELRSFFAYFVNRHQGIKEPLDRSDQITLDLELARLKSENILVLRYGEIEDYLPPTCSGVRGVVELTTNRNWVNDVPEETRRVELGRLISHILSASPEQAEQLEAELRNKTLKFPQPISDPLAVATSNA